MPRTLEQIDTALTALQGTVNTLAGTVAQLGRSVTTLTADLNAVRNGLATIPAPATSLAKAAASLEVIQGQLAPLSTHAQKILAVQAGSMGVG